MIWYEGLGNYSIAPVPATNGPRGTPGESKSEILVPMITLGGLEQRCVAPGSELLLPYKSDTFLTGCCNQV